MTRQEFIALLGAADPLVLHHSTRQSFAVQPPAAICKGEAPRVLATNKQRSLSAPHNRKPISLGHGMPRVTVAEVVPHGAQVRPLGAGNQCARKRTPTAAEMYSTSPSVGH